MRGEASPAESRDNPKQKKIFLHPSNRKVLGPSSSFARPEEAGLFGVIAPATQRGDSAYRQENSCGLTGVGLKRGMI